MERDEDDGAGGAGAEQQVVRVCVIGGSGMLGLEVVREFRSRGWEVWAPSSSELDLRDAVSVAVLAVGDPPFDWCVNCAAYTGVDGAESEPDEALALNMLGPSYLAGACAQSAMASPEDRPRWFGTQLIHLSTDFVFDGAKSAPYVESDKTNPLGAYGRSKLAGEEVVLSSGGRVVRTSWLFGPGRNGGFPGAIVRAMLADKDLRVVADQFGTPTYAPDLARVLADMITKDAAPGIYHAAGPDVVSWHVFAVAVVAAFGAAHGLATVPVVPIPSSDWPSAAPRPPYSALASFRLDELGIEPMRPLAEAVRDWANAFRVTLLQRYKGP